ncbi:exocyst complex component Sec10-domain-containing protein [Obelidium mucronatum]|nr:exocyst complex component Sec10-domain-containing protein [Obelidium mucronatum]
MTDEEILNEFFASSDDQTPAISVREPPPMEVHPVKKSSTIKPRTTSLKKEPIHGTHRQPSTVIPRAVPKLRIDHHNIQIGLGTVSNLTPINATVENDDFALPMASLEHCLNLMKTSKEALAIAAIVESSKMNENAEREFIRILGVIRETHLQPAFSRVISKLQRITPVNNWSAKATTANNLIHFFELVQATDTIHQAVEVFFEDCVRPWIDSGNSLSDSLIQKKAFIRDVDNTVAFGMDKAIQNLVDQIARILDTTQTTADYNPQLVLDTSGGDDSSHDTEPLTHIVFDFKPTRACLDVIECLDKHIDLLRGVTSKDTFGVFFGEVGVRLFSLLCTNIKKHQISQTGAMRLICDINRYNDWVVQLRLMPLQRLFAILKEVGPLFLADGGDELRNLVYDKERYQGYLTVEEVNEMVASRTDYKSIKKVVEGKDGCVIM